MAKYISKNFGGDLAPLNPEFEKIAQAIDKTLSRVGDTPNAVTATIDMNGQRLINLPAPVGANEPARLKDVQSVAQALPDQTGNNNKYLKTDGNVATWQDAVNSFKGRVGEVQPQTDDYTANQIASVNGHVQHDLDSLGFRIESIETTYNNSQWDAAYSWGDHALAGYALQADLQVESKRLDALTVATVAEAKALDVPVGTLVETQGYNSSGDGGANRYVVVAGGTGTDDGGSFIDMTNGDQLKGLFQDSINVKQFGAKGDGASDEDNAFKNALLAAGSTGYVDVDVPPGDYRFADVLKFPAIKGLRLVGIGFNRNTASVSPVRLLGDHLAGAVVWMTKSGQGLKAINIGATLNRQTSYTEGQFGLLIEEGADTSSDKIEGANLEYVSVHNQPSHAVVASGPNFQHLYDGLTTNENKGHSFVVNDGTITGRVNKGRSGGFIVRHFRPRMDEGYRFVLGNEGGLVYRFLFEDADPSGWNIKNTTIAPGAFTGVIYGESVNFINYAFQGRVGGTPTLSAINIYGKSISFTSCRYVGCLDYATVSEEINAGTNDVLITTPYATNDCVLDPAINIVGEVGNVTVFAPIIGGPGEKAPVKEFSSGYNKGVFLTNTNLKLFQKGLIARTGIFDGDTTGGLIVTREGNAASLLVRRTSSGSPVTACEIDTASAEVSFSSTTDSDVVFARNNVKRLFLKSNTINMAGIATSNAGLSSGDLWNDNGTLKIVQ